MSQREYDLARRLNTLPRDTLAITLLVLVALAGLQFTSSGKGDSSTSTTSGLTLTWETAGGDFFGCPTQNCWTPLDPHLSYIAPVESILSNVYEPLLWYNGTSSTEVIPWLAKNYTTSEGGTMLSFTLRDNITFADGQPLNSSDVYFSLNRLLIEDGNSPFGNGNGPSWTLQQLLNRSLSTTIAGPQNYTSAWVEKVLGQGLVQITGRLTFTLQVQNPTASLPYLLAEPWSAIVEPSYVMAHDLALWAAANSSYRQQNLLPYPSLGGSLMNQMVQYFKDEAATCNAGPTQMGCAVTYLESSIGGSLAGTGPYTIQSVSINKSMILQSRDTYWGGPYQFMGGRRITPSIQTVLIRNVPLQSDRTRDLRSAASQGQAMITDLETSFDSTRLFDVVNYTDWVTQGTLVPVFPNVTVSGPVTGYVTYAIPFVTNVTSPSGSSGKTSYQKFQPFADVRFRLAFADSVDLYAVDKQFNNLGQVATGAIPPNLPPLGAYNSSNLPRYHYDPKAAQDLLLSAMSSPLVNFKFYNGTIAPPGVFNNTFGCPQLDAAQRCAKPVTQTIVLGAQEGDALNRAIMNQMAATINNASLTYNMGLQVFVKSIPQNNSYNGPNLRGYYMYQTGWIWDYPWVGDFDVAFFSPSPILSFMPADGWNISSISQTWNQFRIADSQGNLSGVVAANNRLNTLANQNVMYLWTYYPYSFLVYTSNLKGFAVNPSLYGTPFMTLSIGGPSSVGQSGVPFGFDQLEAVLVVGVFAVIGASLYVVRRKSVGTAIQSQRRLSAIMFTDIVGYTAMTQANESKTFKLLKVHREILRPLFAKYGGSEVKTMGDAFLVEFPSALAATECAVEMERAMMRYGTQTNDAEKLRVRIGIHVGDVIHEGGDVYGDAVNIASRIEPLAKGGGICISQQVYDQVRNKVKVRFDKLEPQELKNVSESIGVYKLEIFQDGS